MTSAVLATASNAINALWSLRQLAASATPDRRPNENVPVEADVPTQLPSAESPSPKGANASDVWTGEAAELVLSRLREANEHLGVESWDAALKTYLQAYSDSPEEFRKFVDFDALTGAIRTNHDPDLTRKAAGAAKQAFAKLLEQLEAKEELLP